MLFPATAAASPIQFGPYLLTECVGQGGMAVVYKAMRTGPAGFAKTVVVKAMLPTLSAQREFVAMFSSEARIMAQLTHPNIVQVHDFGVVDGIPYLVMEFLPGRNLSQLRNALAAAKVKLPVGAALTIAREMCHGLGYAHNAVDDEGKKRRVIHRDVSPSNVMVCRDGGVKLLDFGVAKIVGEFELDVTQSLKGKYAYMAPEQVAHQPIDCRVDVFAAGVVLHELLTGKRLFAANSELETLQRVQAAQVIVPSVDNKEVPRALDAIVKKALARDPRDRYNTGAELAEALESLDALAWPRKRVAGLIADLFAHEWMVVCDVCGKPVMPGTECIECGTRAPESAPHQLPEPVADAQAALLPLQHTDRNPVEDSLQPLPSSGSEPLPLPPPPATTAPRRAPKILPNQELPQRHLHLVRTPVPPPLAQPDAGADAEADALQGPTDPQIVAPVVAGEFEAAPPPRLFVVPPLDAGAALPDVLATPRPAAPQPLFALPASVTLSVPRPRGLTVAIVVLALVAAVLFVILALIQDPPKPEPLVPAAVPSALAPSLPAPPSIEPPKASVAEPKETIAEPKAMNAAPSKASIAEPAPKPARASVHRHRPRRPAGPAAPAAPADDRSINQGRLVDPFAESN